MTKRQHLTLEEVLDDVLSDNEDYDDPHEPVMEGSDDEFSDLELDERDFDDCGTFFDQMDPNHPANPGELPGTHSPTLTGTPGQLSLSTPSPPSSPDATSPSSQSSSGT